MVRQFYVLMLLLVVSGCARKMCPKTYDVRYLPGVNINIDGVLDEPDWGKAHSEKGFTFPWEKRPAPGTEFRALCDDRFLYFSFQVHDDDIVVVKDRSDDETVVRVEDRVEIFFTPDNTLKKYFCMEIDPLGRIYDYQACYYRKFDASWDWPGLCAKGSITGNSYIVEGSIGLKDLESLGLPALSPGNVLKTGLFRGEFSHGQGDEPEAHWISWVNPKGKTPDFHVPRAFGCLRMVK
jgi:hypothetical protein